LYTKKKKKKKKRERKERSSINKEACKLILSAGTGPVTETKSPATATPHYHCFRIT